jgi:hypothetical protein
MYSERYRSRHHSSNPGLELGKGEIKPQNLISTST